jgi:glycosyltransferase involved in cell wall biosynthesis
MEGYTFERVFIASTPRPSASAVIGALRAQAHFHRYDLVHVHGEVAAGLCLAGLALRPSVVTINGLHLTRRLNHVGKSVAKANLRLITRAASATICVGSSELTDVRAVVGDSDRLVLVHNGVTAIPTARIEERAAARDELELHASDVVGVCLAALDLHKEPLIAAQAALAAAEEGLPVVMLFAGDGPLRPELEALAHRSRAVRVLGFRRDTARVLAAADFFVLPSRREGLSFGLLEAMSAGLPPIVSDAPGNRDAVGAAGIVVPAGDAARFTEALKGLVDDERGRLAVGERAKMRAAEFSSREMLRRTREVYARILGPVT